MRPNWSKLDSLVYKNYPLSCFQFCECVQCSQWSNISGLNLPAIFFSISKERFRLKNCFCLIVTTIVVARMQGGPGTGVQTPAHWLKAENQVVLRVIFTDDLD